MDDTSKLLLGDGLIDENSQLTEFGAKMARCLQGSDPCRSHQIACRLSLCMITDRFMSKRGEQTVLRYLPKGERLVAIAKSEAGNLAGNPIKVRAS